MNYGQIKDKEEAAIRAAIASEEALLVGWEQSARTARGVGEPRKFEARAELAKRQIALLTRTLEMLRQPFRTPATFAQADAPAYHPLVRTHREKEELEKLTKNADDPNRTDYRDKCKALSACHDAIAACICQKVRVKLLPEFWRDVLLWEPERITKELEEREFELKKTYPCKRRLSVFTTDDLIVDEDPADIAGPFLQDLIHELRKLLNQRLSASLGGTVDAFVEAVGQKAVAEIAAKMGAQVRRDQLVAKADELKKFLPVGFHRDLDEYFRRQMDRLVKGENIP